MPVCHTQAEQANIAASWIGTEPQMCKTIDTLLALLGAEPAIGQKKTGMPNKPTHGIEPLSRCSYIAMYFVQVSTNQPKMYFHDYVIRSHTQESPQARTGRI